MKHIEKIEKLPLSKRVDENTVVSYEGYLADIINKINELVDAVGDKHTSFIQSLIQIVEGKKRVEYQSSKLIPNGNGFTNITQETYIDRGFNSALDTIIKMLREEME
jgi:hypothetical protein